jgi:hypothetical protein
MLFSIASLSAMSGLMPITDNRPFQPNNRQCTRKKLFASTGLKQHGHQKEKMNPQEIIRPQTAFQPNNRKCTRKKLFASTGLKQHGHQKEQMNPQYRTCAVDMVSINAEHVDCTIVQIGSRYCSLF